MKELSSISKSRNRQDASDAVLATIVNVSGSSYRRPGAHMLLFSTGETIGSISGGCLEQDVVAHAEKVRASGTHLLLTYDTTSEEDITFGVGLACKGIIEIWLEPLSSAMAMLDFYDELVLAGDSGIIATTYKGPSAGTRSYFRDPTEGFRSSTVTDEAGTATFHELVQPPVRLFIFGAGYDAIPLARFAKQLGYEVNVVDRRPAYATRERFPEVDQVMVKDVTDIPELGITKRTAAVIMSHHYLSDRDYLKALLPLSLVYLGLMGPRRRAEKMLQEFSDDGLVFDNELLQKLHNPVGLNIGAEGPDEIALAVLSEITAIFAGRDGGMLRNQKGPIHPRLVLQ